MHRSPIRGVLFLVTSVIAALGFWSSFGCSGPMSPSITGETSGESSPSDASKSVIQITGSVTSASFGASGTGKSVGAKGTAVELSCSAFSSEGEELGSAIIGADGSYGIDVPEELLKPTDASATRWDAKIFIKCADSAGQFDWRNYCESKIEEGKTQSVVCHATPDTTLATMDFLAKSGCQIGASCSVAELDPLCFVELQTAVYEAARADATTDVRDEIAVIRDMVGRCMSEAGHSVLGFSSAAALVTAIQEGVLTDEQMKKCGVSEKVRDKYVSGASKVTTDMRDIFYANYAGDKAAGNEGSPCALTRSDRNFAKKLVETYTLAENGDVLEKMKQADVRESIVAGITQHCSGGSCDHEKIKPEVLIARVKTKLAPNPVTQILSEVKKESKVERKIEQKVEESKPVAVQPVLIVEKKSEEKKAEEKRVEDIKVEEKKVEEKKVEEKKGDTTPPEIQAVGPSAGSENVHRSASISVWFNEAIDPATINSSTFYVADGKGRKVAGEVGHNSKTNTSFFIPDGYQSLAPYTIVLTTGVKDLAGNTLAGNFTSTFVTALEPPYGLKTSGSSTANVVAWTELPGATSYNLYWSTSPDVSTKTGKKVSKINGTSYAHTGLTEGTTYYYVVTANHSNGKHETDASEKTRETTMAFATEVVASDIGDVNNNVYSSMAMDSAGKIHIAYYDGANGDLIYATNASGQWVKKTIDGGDFVGQHTSIQVDSSDHAHISYYGGNESSLKYATNAPSGVWKIATIDSARNKTIGQFTSLALDATSVHIAYWDMSGDLKYATNRGGPWEKYIVDAGDGAYGLPKSSLLGLYTNIQVDPAGTLHISYYDDANGDLKYARKEINKVWVLETVDSEGRVGAGTDLAVDASLNVYIAYKDATNDLLKLGKRMNGKWEVITVEGGGVGYEPSIDIDDRGRLQISYRDSANGAVKLATKGSAGWASSIIDAGTSWGGHGTTLRTDTRRTNPTGKVHMAYYDLARKQLKYTYQK